jgi:recombination protein RecT
MTTQTVSGALARRETGITSVMWDRKTHFAAILPDHIDVKAFLGTAAAALYKDDKLMAAAEANPESLITALMRCAALGHQPGTDEFYLTPRKGKIVGIEGYRGIIERMYRSGAVKTVIVREVCAKDEFSYIEGVHDKPRHVFSKSGTHGTTGADFFGAAGSLDRGQMVGVYAYAILMTGAVSRVVILTRDDVMAAREASDAKDSDYSPWNRLDGGKDHPEFTGRSMWWKTAARRLEPWVPTSAEYRREQLRAAAAAAEQTAPPAMPAAAGNGQHVTGPEPEVVEAELVDEPQTSVPAAEPDDTRNGGRPATAGTEHQAARSRRTAETRLADLFRQLELDEEEQATVTAWLAAGEWTASASQVKNVASVLDDFLTTAKGDVAAARTGLWDAYRKAQEASREV